MALARFRQRRSRIRPYRKRTWKKMSRRYRWKRPRTVIHQFKRTTTLTPITLGNASVNGALTFKLGDLDDYTEFTTLFDSYRLVAVKVKFVPNFSNANITPTANLGIHSIHSVIDQNDSNNPSDVLSMMQYDTYKRKRLDRGMTRYLRVATIANTGGYNAGLDWKRWLNTNYELAEYNGLKYWFDALEEDTTLTVDVFATYYIQCKSIK